MISHHPAYTSVKLALWDRTSQYIRYKYPPLPGLTSAPAAIGAGLLLSLDSFRQLPPRVPLQFCVILKDSDLRGNVAKSWRVIQFSLSFRHTGFLTLELFYPMRPEKEMMRLSHPGHQLEGGPLRITFR